MYIPAVGVKCKTIAFCANNVQNLHYLPNPTVIRRKLRFLFRKRKF